MTAITGSEVWNNVLVDKEFAATMQIEAVRDAFRPFVEASPTVLAAYLDRPVSFKELSGAKIAFLRHCLANGFAEKMAEVASLPSDFLKNLLEGLLEIMAGILQDVPAFLTANGVTEKEVMLSTHVGLNVENQARYVLGTLTIGDVLRTQPAVLLKNGD